MYNAIHKEASFESKCKLQIKKNSLHDAIFALHIIPSCINRINKYFTINTKKKKKAQPILCLAVLYRFYRLGVMYRVSVGHKHFNNLHLLINDKNRAKLPPALTKHLCKYWPACWLGWIHSTPTN